MDHDVVVRQKMTERYLLDELNPEVREEFEEHFFDCPDCAVDVRAGALFVDQSKVVFANETGAAPAPLAVPAPAPVVPGWIRWFRPTWAVPVMALLLTVVGYQNLVERPQMQVALNTPQVLPYGSVNVGAYGSDGPVITTRPGVGFLLFMRIPPETGYSSYTADLYNPAGKLEWSLNIPAPPASSTSTSATTQDQWSVQVPAANRPAGNYIVKVHGITTSGESKVVGQASFELQIQP
jgi:Putative zinc-finger